MSAEGPCPDERDLEDLRTQRGRRRPWLLPAALLGVAAVAVLAVALWRYLPNDTVTSGAGSAPPPAGPDASGADARRDAGASGAGGLCGDAAGRAGERDPGVPGRDVTLPPVCAERGTLVATSVNALGVRATWEVGVDAVACASDILEAYRATDGVTLEHDGYLDLFGRVWGCVVASDAGWAEMAVVEGEGDADGFAQGRTGGGERCTVTLVRFGQGSQEEVAQGAPQESAAGDAG